MQSVSRTKLINMLLFLVTLGLSACSFTATPAADLLDRNDHVALAAWYDNDAARLRQKAKEMDQMVEESQRNPEQALRRMSHGSPKLILSSNVRSSPRPIRVPRGKPSHGASSSRRKPGEEAMSRFSARSLTREDRMSVV